MKRHFLDPVAQVVIRDHESGEQWNLGSPGFPFLTSLTLTFDANMTSTIITVGIDMPYDYSIRMLDSNTTVFKKNNQIKARIGYASGGWLDWVYGTMTNGGKGLSIGPEGLTGSFEADVTPVKASGYTLSKDVMFESGEDIQKLLSSICRNLGREAVFSPGVKGNIENYFDKIAAEHVGWEGEYAISGIADKSAFDAMKYVCEEYLDCKFMETIKSAKKYTVFYTDKEMVTGILRDYNGNTSDGTINKYVIRGILDPDRNQYPCFSFSPVSGDETTWIAGTSAGSGVNAYGVDKEAGETVSTDIAPEDQPEAMVGKVENTTPQDIRSSDSTGSFVADAFKNDGKYGTYMSMPVFPGGMNVFKGQAARFQRQGNPGIRMRIDTLGIPEERVGNICEVFGAGRLYNDLYYIDNIVHSWNPGSWSMGVNVHRWGYKDVSGEQKESAGGQMQ